MTKRRAFERLRCARSFDAKTDLARARFRPSLRLFDGRHRGMRRTVGWWMGARTHRDHRVQIVLELGGRVVLGDAREVRVRARPRGDAPASEREVVALSLSRDCARRNKERVGDGGREGTGGRSARARVQDSSAWITRSLASRASRRPARSRDARAPGPGQSRDSLSLASEEIFEEAAASVGKEAYPRRPGGAYRFGSRRPPSRQCPGARSTRGPAEANEQTAPSATDIAAVGVFVRGEATRRVSSRAMRRGRTRGRLRAVPSGRKQPRRERRARATRGTTARAFVRRPMLFQNRSLSFAGRNSFARVFLTPRAAAPWHLPKIFSQQVLRKFDV